MSLIKVSLCVLQCWRQALLWLHKNSFDCRRGRQCFRFAKVTFKNGSLTMAGNLYLPPDYDSARKYPAIVVSHPRGALRSRHPGFTHNSWQSVGLLLWLMMRRIMVKAVGCLVTGESVRPCTGHPQCYWLSCQPAAG